MSSSIESLYGEVNATIDGVLRDNPPFACRAGCTSCCYGPPMVTALEWQILHQHLLTRSKEDLDRIMNMAELLLPMLPPMMEWQKKLETDERDEALAVRLQCPFLIEGKCDVYEARPIICRGYGYVSMDLPDGTETMWISELGRRHIELTFPEKKPRTRLPLIRPWLTQAKTLSKEAKGKIAWLPLWLWSHIDLKARTLKQEVDLAPDFSKLSELVSADVARDPRAP
jgi:Fe-S-cluster containining protein